MSDDSHPLYPKKEEQRRISLYAARECAKCGETKYDVDWRDVTTVTSNSMWYGGGHTSTITKDLVKWCNKCYEYHNNFPLWG